LNAWHQIRPNINQINKTSPKLAVEPQSKPDLTGFYCAEKARFV
jgi:hypothetical protein